MVYDPNDKPVNAYARAYAEFIEQTEEHTLTATVDDGLNRQLRVGAANTGIWSWRVATWPGYLATFGDIADGFMFTRAEDMIGFFDSGGRRNYYSDGAPCIDFRYWAEKLSGGRSHDVREFSRDSFIELVTEALDEHDDLGVEAREEYDNIVEVAKRVCLRHGVDYAEYLAELRVSQPYRGHGLNAPRGAPRFRDLEIDSSAADERNYFGEPIPEKSPTERCEEILTEARLYSDSEDEVRDWLRENQSIFGEDAYYDWDMRDYNVHFIYACYAIDLTVSLWRQYEASPEAEAHRNRGDSYILLEGGLVQNSPSIPVFNLDVLDSDAPDHSSANDALELYERIMEHPQAPDALGSALDNAAAFVRNCGDAKAIATIDSHEAQRPVPAPELLVA